MFTVTVVPVDLLKPHPKNKDLPPLDDKIRREMAEDIRQNGIATPLILARDYTILAGYQRWEIAKELGMTHVPAIVRHDIESDTVEAVAFLIKDNLLRRHYDEMTLAKQIRELKELVGMKRGRPRAEVGANDREKHETVAEFPRGSAQVGAGTNGNKKQALSAEFLGLSERRVRELDKLNELIPELQGLVSQRKLSSKAAYSLAFLPPEEQRDLLKVLGESGVCGLSVQEAQELRRQLDAERTRIAQGEARIRDLERQLAAARASSGESERLAAELARLREENERLKARGPEVVEKVVEKVVTRPDAAQEAEINRLRAQVEQLEARLRDATGEEEVARLRQTKAELEAEVRYLERTRQRLGEAVSCLAFCRKLLDPLIQNEPEFRERIARTRFTGAFVLDPVRWIGVLERYVELLREAVEVGQKGEVYDVMAIEVSDVTWKEGAGGE